MVKHYISRSLEICSNESLLNKKINLIERNIENVSTKMIASQSIKLMISFKFDTKRSPYTEKKIFNIYFPSMNSLKLKAPK